MVVKGVNQFDMAYQAGFFIEPDWFITFLDIVSTDSQRVSHYWETVAKGKSYCQLKTKLEVNTF